jgi:hypothetical protein
LDRIHQVSWGAADIDNAWKVHFSGSAEGDDGDGSDEGDGDEAADEGGDEEEEASRLQV